MRQLTILTLVFTLTLQIHAQNKKEKDQNAIKKMCGCYEVGFNFAETFSYSKDSTYKPSKVKHDKALEWVELVDDSENKIILQHLLIAGRGGKKMIIKHWRQDWMFENTNFYMYNGDNKWKYVKKDAQEVENQWTQKVYQVDDSPRYEGSATWIHADGKSYWENTTDAPLPRRERTKRKDYNVTVRTNKHEITKDGWIHDQDNDKVIREIGKEDVILAQEKGLNTYVKVEDSKCKAAQDWWSENNKLWKLVRKNWDKEFNKNKDLELATKVDDKRLYQHMFALKKDAKNKEIKKIISEFVK
ncbi:DUF6607 family protein [uncultured Polaribacter sp.]|uniref:DUF6607 family protein n=1 Tax=uncultured Polaribacter sp. TaxID=174711 RepID=UPI00262AF2A3|nr:DUF6607 family protein [uncultured Polaribacter sp.]